MSLKHVFPEPKCLHDIFQNTSRKEDWGKDKIYSFMENWGGRLLDGSPSGLLDFRLRTFGTGSMWPIALCSYPLKLEIQKFGKVKAQFSLNFVPNFKISVLTGKELYKIWGKNIFFEYLSKMCHLKAKNLLLVSEKPQILHRRKLCRA